jgi:hypothetical protein
MAEWQENDMWPPRHEHGSVFGRGGDVTPVVGADAWNND